MVLSSLTPTTQGCRCRVARMGTADESGSALRPSYSVQMYPKEVDLPQQNPSGGTKERLEGSRRGAPFHSSIKQDLRRLDYESEGASVLVLKKHRAKKTPCSDILL